MNFYEKTGKGSKNCQNQSSLKNRLCHSYSESSSNNDNRGNSGNRSRSSYISYSSNINSRSRRSNRSILINRSRRSISIASAYLEMQKGNQ